MTEIQTNKKILMIAFHFPPDASIGAQRTFKTAVYLPEHGWDPIFLTANEKAYASVEKSQNISKILQSNIYIGITKRYEMKITEFYLAGLLICNEYCIYRDVLSRKLTNSQINSCR